MLRRCKSIRYAFGAAFARRETGSRPGPGGGAAVEIRPGNQAFFSIHYMYLSRDFRPNLG
jgi:hypothetical protein